jgi:hypothetical protein
VTPPSYENIKEIGRQTLDQLKISFLGSCPEAMSYRSSQKSPQSVNSIKSSSYDGQTDGQSADNTLKRKTIIKNFFFCDFQRFFFGKNCNVCISACLSSRRFNFSDAD